MNVEELYKSCKNQLEKAKIEDASFEALCILESAAKFDRTFIVAHGNTQVDEKTSSMVLELAKRRASREPLQYVLGKWNFAGIDFAVGSGVLIPRDDTEVVLNLCIDFLKGSSSKKTADLCAGSGAICIALQKLCNAEVDAVELYDAAFDYLEQNIHLNNSTVNAVRGDIAVCHKLYGCNTFDLIVSNPPYIKTDELSTLQYEVQSEPVTALDGGIDGLDFYRTIITLWSCKLKKGGALALEIGENQADRVAELMREHGYENIKTSLDLGGVQRAIIGTLK